MKVNADHHPGGFTKTYGKLYFNDNITQSKEKDTMSSETRTIYNYDQIEVTPDNKEEIMKQAWNDGNYLQGTAKEIPLQKMPKYKCHKDVWALKIKDLKPAAAALTGETDNSLIITPEETGYASFKVDSEYQKKHNPKRGGYYIVYEDGHKSFSLAEVFENGYSRK